MCRSSLPLLAILLIGCGDVVETRDEPLQLAPSAVSLDHPLGLPLGQGRDAVDDAASNLWGARPSTCTNGRLNTTGVKRQSSNLVGGRQVYNECSYMENECDSLPSADPRLEMLRCDYPSTMSGVDGRELVLTFVSGKLAAVSDYDSFIDEPTARASGDALIRLLDATTHGASALTKPRRRVLAPTNVSGGATVMQRISWSSAQAESRVELIENDDHVWSIGYTTMARDPVVWLAGTDQAGQPRSAGDEEGVTVAGPGAGPAISATPEQIDHTVDNLLLLADGIGLCAPSSHRPPPQGELNDQY